MAEVQQTIVEAAQLGDVVLLKSHFELVAKSVPKGGGKLVLTIGARGDYPAENARSKKGHGDLTASISGISIKNEKPVFKCELLIRVPFALARRSAWSDAEKHRFLVGPVVRHAWPVIRDLVLHFTIRAGLPPVKLPDSPPATDEESTDSDAD